MTTTTENVPQGNTRKRRILTYEPNGLSSELIAAELKRNVRPGQQAPKGSLKKLLTDAVVAFLGPKYPKIVAAHRS